MGREIRRVPPNWNHPRKPIKGYKPMFNKSCEEAWKEWQDEYKDWLNGEHDRVIADYGSGDYPKDQPYASFCRWYGSPPDCEYYRPLWKDGEATWYQVYETVSEGTPVTPPFSTQAELVDYLVQNGDFWDQKRRKEGRSIMLCDPWPLGQAESFVYGAGWAPSLVMDSKGIRSGVEALADIERQKQ